MKSQNHSRTPNHNNEIRKMFEHCDDIVFWESALLQQPKVTLVYADGLCSTDELNHLVISKLLDLQPLIKKGGQLEMVRAHLAVSSSATVSDMMHAAMRISAGDALLIIEGEADAVLLGLSGMQTRDIEEPAAETVVRGPREGFNESLSTSLSLLRRHLGSPALKVEQRLSGERTGTMIALVYVKGLAAESLLTQARERLSRIRIDGIIDSSYVEELIEDQPLSPFPQMLATERPDVVNAALLEGKIAILVDGSPFALVAPITLPALLHSPEDYYQRPLLSTSIRWLRYFFAMIALMLPSIYVAILSYHQEMLPTTLLFTIVDSRERIPFPALVEALLMEVVFESLREAGIRLPKQVGAAVSIVGALVIGQAAIQAGIVSSPMVMVVAITGISSFMIPNFALGGAIRVLRFPIMLGSGVLGLYGMMLCLLLIVTHLLSLRSFGLPYLSPLAPVNFQEWKDSVVRAPRRWMRRRPSSGQLPGGQRLENQERRE